MQFYRAILERTPGAAPTDYSHHTTLDEAHKAAKGYPDYDRPYVFVDMIDIPTDKAGVLDLLRGYQIQDVAPKRNWRLTKRGGLEEFAVPNGR